MKRITLAEAREDWDGELRARGWHKSKIRLAMFDYDAAKHGPISYHPAPAWPTIANATESAKLPDYEQLKRMLLQQGERFSSMGSASSRHSSSPERLARRPLAFSSTAVRQAIAAVMDCTHPLAVTQEQILRAAFIAHLPPSISLAIGTPESAVHPERPTPSLYRHTGKKFTPARFDLGFGDVEATASITGVMELKAGSASFDNLKRKGELITIEHVNDTPKRKRQEPISVDIQKLLDLKLPSSAFRISWIALGRTGSASPQQIADHAGKIVHHSSRLWAMKEPSVGVDQNTGWLQFRWNNTGVVLELAWYRPSSSEPSKFEAIWGHGGKTQNGKHG